MPVAGADRVPFDLPVCIVNIHRPARAVYWWACKMYAIIPG